MPAAAVLTVVFRAASAERARVREEQHAERTAAATALARELDGSVARAKSDLRAIAADVTKEVLIAELARTQPAIADAVVIASSGELISPAPPGAEAAPTAECVAARAALETADRIAARDRIVSGCVHLRSERGRYVWPLLALETGAADALSDWMEQHADRLGVAERLVLVDRATRALLPGPERNRVLAALERTASAHERLSVLASDRSGDDTLEAGVHVRAGLRRALSITRTFSSANGIAGGFLIHEDSLARAPLPPGLVLLARPGGASGEPTDIVVTPQLVMRVVERDPAAAAARARWLGDRLALLGGLAVAVAVALAALLFARSMRAQRLAELRTDFVAAVSHELRTPLASVRMFAELLERGDVAPEERSEVHHALADESRRLSATLERMLRFGALSRGKLGIEKERVLLRTIAEQAAARFRLGHPKLEVVVSVDDPTRRALDGGSDIEAHADPTLLGLALDNLLSNAAKYAPRGAPYSILVSASGSDARIAVSDRGPGLDAAARTRVFLPFERADDRLSRATEGTGIGLALVRGIARAHGGDATVESTSGGGATFVVRFPREQN